MERSRREGDKVFELLCRLQVELLELLLLYRSLFIGDGDVCKLEELLEHTVMLFRRSLFRDRSFRVGKNSCNLYTVILFRDRSFRVGKTIATRYCDAVRVFENLEVIATNDLRNRLL